MSGTVSTTFKIDLSDGGTVTAKIDAPVKPKPDTPFFILAHGANNDLDFPLLAFLAQRLADASLASVVRFNFPYVERGVTSPDPRAVLESTFMSVYAHVRAELSTPRAPVFAGGKSLGGRTAAELVSRRHEGLGLDAAGLIILGYPLHAMGRRDSLFVEPLRHVGIPSLFLVGSRDSLCDPGLLRPILARLDHPGTLYVVEGGDHSLHLPRGAGRQPDASYAPVAAEVARFIAHIVA
ncbi:MAG: hypothetical protein A2133_10355 [Actinobacteria bacterium RBG_16_64_13]|nr:MAG: hypothetical protein A2133_10355 [Actinobacteria bacterium RBG_16_64_13]